MFSVTRRIEMVCFCENTFVAIIVGLVYLVWFLAADFESVVSARFHIREAVRNLFYGIHQ